MQHDGESRARRHVTRRHISANFPRFRRCPDGRRVAITGGVLHRRLPPGVGKRAAAAQRWGKSEKHDEIKRLVWLPSAVPGREGGHCAFLDAQIDDRVDAQVVVSLNTRESGDDEGESAFSSACKALLPREC